MMSWTNVILLVGLAGMAFIAIEAVTSLRWSPAKSKRLRRGSTYSPGEALWMLVYAALMVALMLWAVG